MTASARIWPKLAVLAVIVLALHLWLLGAMPRVIAPVQRAMPWLARTVTPPPVAETPAPQVATNPPRITAAIGALRAMAATSPDSSGPVAGSAYMCMALRSRARRSAESG